MTYRIWAILPKTHDRKKIVRTLGAENARAAGWMGAWICRPIAASKRSIVLIPLKVACIVIEARRLPVRW